MTLPARVFKVENKLAKVVRLPGGRTVAEAIGSADKRIAGVKDVCISAMQERVRRLAGLAESGRAGTARVLDEIYATANEILGLAGSFQMTELGQAASSLCDITDAFREGAPVSWPAIDVHVDGLRMLSVEACKPDDRQRILIGLLKVRSRFIANAEA